MAYVIAEPCIDVKDGGCVDVCPVDCIEAGEEMFYINPQECINCSLCVDVCPVDAIFEDLELPKKWFRFVEVNRSWFDAK